MILSYYYVLLFVMTLFMYIQFTMYICQDTMERASHPGWQAHGQAMDRIIIPLIEVNAIQC